MLLMTSRLARPPVCPSRIFRIEAGNLYATQATIHRRPIYEKDDVEVMKAPS
jgi:hypothetical protein